MRILLVEDQPDLAASLAGQLEKSDLGFTVVAVDGLARARARLTHDPGQLVIAEFSLPDGLGSELLSEGDCALVLLAEPARLAEASEALLDGALDVVCKDPASLAVLPFRAAKAFQTARDSAELGRARKALVASEERFHQTFHNQAVGIVHVGPEGGFLRANQKFCSLVGYSSLELASLTFQQITHPDDLKEDLALLENLKAGRTENFTVQKRYLRKDGSTVWAELAVAPVWGDDGQVAYFIGIVEDISARREAEEGLLRSEEKFAKAFNASPVWVSITSAGEGVFLEVNEAFCRVTGYDRRETIGNSALEMGFWPDPGERARVVDECLSGNGLRDREIKLIFKDDQTHTMLWSAQPMQYQGRLCLVNVMVDVSDRLAAEEARRESEQRFRQLFDQMVSGFALHELITDQSGKPVDYRFLDVNPAFEEMTGLVRSQVLGKTVKELMPGTEDEWIEVYGDVALSGRPRRLERYSRELGKDFEALAFCPKRGQFAVTFSDVTERNQAVEALAASEARLKAIFNSSKDAIVTLDVERRLVSVNPAFTGLFGWLPEEAEGENALLFHLSQEECDRFGSTAYPWLARQGYWRGEWQYRTKSGREIPVETVISSITDRQGAVQGYVAVMRDITDRLVAEEERKRLETQLRQAQKMEAIGTLAGGIAHDFNNILAAIIGYSELIIGDLSEGSLLRDNAQQVLAAGVRARDLVRQILAFSRQNEQERLPITLGSVVKEALRLLRSSLPSTIQIEWQIEDGLGAVMADPTQIHQVLMNLCTNAAHAMGARGGHLVASLSMEELSARDAHLKAPARPGVYQVLSVSDDGAGMDKTVLERIWEPYFTTKGRGEGTGLGLAVVHGIVQNHGGFLSVYSEPGKGSTFRVYLPQVHAAARPEARGAKPLPGGKERILVVDDEEAVAELLKRSLSRLGYQVVAETDSRKALADFAAEPDSFDLVISDQTMPEMTGLELLREIMRIKPGASTLLCTGFSAQVNRAVVLELGIGALLMKPVVTRQLAVTVRALLDGAGRVETV